MGQGPGYLRVIINQNGALPVLQQTQFICEGGLRLDAALKCFLLKKKRFLCPPALCMHCGVKGILEKEHKLL